MLTEIVGYGGAAAGLPTHAFLLPLYRTILCPTLLLGLTVEEVLRLPVLQGALDLIYTLWKCECLLLFTVDCIARS